MRLSHVITVFAVVGWLSLMSSSVEAQPEGCGDSIVGPGEQCDDGNNTDGDGCSANCILEYCSDGILQVGLFEQCDDGNNTDGDGCSHDCLLETAGAVPTVSEWGIATLALLLLVGGRVYFKRRRATAA
jgi:cysteine-rich repeat protein